MTFDFGWLGCIYLLAVAWPLARIDIREKRLPNTFTVPLFPVAIFGQISAVLLGAELSRFLTALLAAVLAFTICLALNRYASLGMGDVKLISGITLSLAWLNPTLPAVAVLIALVVAGIYSLLMVALGKTKMGSSIALGPFLLIGFAMSLIAQGWS